MVERGDRAPVSTFFHDDALVPGAVAVLPEAAAHHARVKRLAPGDRVRLTDGRGARGEGRIARVAKAALEVDVQRVERVPPPLPLELYPPVGDRDRMLLLAEKAVELGATAWRPVRFHRSRSVSPRGEGPAFAAKIRARMIGALEQSGGAWLPVVHPEVDPDAAARVSDPPVRLMLDAGGQPPPLALVASAGVAVILGPEGGLEEAEHAVLAAAGWRPTALAPSTLRFETAGIAALAVVRAAQVRHPEEPHG